MRPSLIVGGLLCALGCNSAGGAGNLTREETAEKTLTAAAPPPSAGELNHRLANDPRHGQPFPGSEALKVTPPSLNQDPNPLPSNAREMGPAGQLLEAQKREAKLRAPLSPPEPAMKPEPALLAQQQAYLRAWQARQREFDAMNPLAREKALAALKQQFVKEGR